jgi:hypothetical protein
VLIGVFVLSPDVGLVITFLAVPALVHTRSPSPGGDGQAMAGSPRVNRLAHRPHPTPATARKQAGSYRHRNEAGQRVNIADGPDVPCPHACRRQAVLPVRAQLDTLALT